MCCNLASRISLDCLEESCSIQESGNLVRPRDFRETLTYIQSHMLDTHGWGRYLKQDPWIRAQYLLHACTKDSLEWGYQLQPDSQNYHLETKIPFATWPQSDCPEMWPASVAWWMRLFRHVTGIWELGKERWELWDWNQSIHTALSTSHLPLLYLIPDISLVEQPCAALFLSSCHIFFSSIFFPLEFSFYRHSQEHRLSCCAGFLYYSFLMAWTVLGYLIISFFLFFCV